MGFSLNFAVEVFQHMIQSFRRRRFRERGYIAWPPISPDQSPLDCFCGIFLKQTLRDLNKNSRQVNVLLPTVNK